MTRDPRYDILFEPVRIGPVTARNRFFQVAHCNGLGWTQPQALAELRGIKAEGGWAVVTTEDAPRPVGRQSRQPRGAHRPVTPPCHHVRSGAGPPHGQGRHPQLRRWHRDAALRAKRAGFDIVYVYAGHELGIPMHFLNRRMNDRTDEYGGSLENRARLLRELIEDTKDAVGDTCGVAVRIAVEELLGDDGHHLGGRRPRRDRHAGGTAGPLGCQHLRLGQ
jgi:dimethylamine/trimethylamine dehydrogenase